MLAGVSLLSTGANIPLAQMVVVTSCNLRWWCFILQPLAQIVHLHTWWFTLCNLRWWCFFIHPLAQRLHLHSGNLHCVVAVCGSGSCIMWKWRIYIYIYKTPLAHVVVSPIATCAGGAFPSTHWRRYQAYARATCTVWWCILGGGGRCILVWGGSGCCYGVLVLGKCTGVRQRK